MKAKFSISVEFDASKTLRRLSHEERVNDLREGRRNRATTFRVKKGKGSYTRKTKHKEV